MGTSAGQPLALGFLAQQKGRADRVSVPCRTKPGKPRRQNAEATEFHEQPIVLRWKHLSMPHL